MPVGALEARARRSRTGLPSRNSAGYAAPPRRLDRGRDQRGPDALAAGARAATRQRAEHPHLDQRPARVDPGPAEPDVAEDVRRPARRRARTRPVVAEAGPRCRRTCCTAVLERRAPRSRGARRRGRPAARGGPRNGNHATQPGTASYGAAHGYRVARLPDRSRDAGALRQRRRGPRHPPRRPHAGQPDVLVGQLPAAAGSARPTPRTRSGGSPSSRRSSPRRAHRTFGIDGRDGSADDLAPFAELGLDVDESSVMTATSVHEPPRPNTDGDVPDAGVGRGLGPAGRAGPGRRGPGHPQPRLRDRPCRGGAAPRRRRVRRLVGRVRGRPTAGLDGVVHGVARGWPASRT